MFESNARYNHTGVSRGATLNVEGASEPIRPVDFIKLSQKYNQREKTQSPYSFDILTHTRMKKDQ